MLFSLYFQLCLGVMICLEFYISSGERTYMNQFAVRVDRGKEIADKIAAKHGFLNLGQIGSLSGYYLFEHNHISKRSLESSHHHHKKLTSEPEISWVEQQIELKRSKRDHIYSEYGPMGRGIAKFRSKNGPRPSSYNSFSGVFPDPLYPEQWYLHGGAVDGWDMNVMGAWKKGFTGKGVVVSILDDGIQTNHPDLIQNYDPLASTDINGNDDDPMPQDNGDNKHGTRCAGEVSATAFNNICGVGIAYNASIGGVRMLDGTVNDAVEARALSLHPNHIDIYSASWGPEDDGKTVDGPGPLARRAFLDGVTMGRKGKGSIFVWASGNGGRHTDNCNCDGYTNSIFTLSISSVTQRGLKPWYLEECSSTLATTYSSGTPGHDKNIVTVDMDPRFNSDTMCTRDHTGTSASAPIAAAMCALALEANPNLTWRDMQYLVVLTSRPEPLEKEDGWYMNGVNRKVSHKFGYGLMDAAEMTTLAQNWNPVPPQHICETHEDLYQREIPSGYGEKLEIYMDTDACWNTPNVVNYLEHVQAKLTIRYNPRGNLKIILVSPSGTRSVLLFPRPRDLYQTNFEDWPFLSVHFWGEKAAGRWKLTIINAGSAAVQEPGILKKWSLIFHGTEQNPNRRSRPRSDPPQFAASSISSSMAELQNKDCHEECLGGCFGKGADLCKECRHFKMEGNPRICVKSCSEGYFASKNLCQPCDPSCKTCSDGNSNNCLSCVEGLLFIEGTNECLKQCPEGYYLDEAQKACFRCSPVCDSCSKASNNCTRCRAGLLTFGTSCMAACPKKTYEDEKQRCLPCHDLCETCMGPLQSECVTCPRSLVHLNGTCLEACPDGYYSDSFVNECYSCDPVCQTCNKTQCLTCQKDWMLDSKGVCRHKSDECSQGHYTNGDKCLPCHISCENCNGAAYSQCLSCPIGRFLYKNTCVEKCPSNTFSTSNRECIQCHETCLTCTGSAASECKTCKKGLQLHNNLCTTACGERYYAEEGLCKPCHSSCLTCSGPKENHCITCPSELQLVEGKCQKSCPIGFFAKDGACYSCHHTCHTCKGNGLHDCLSCHSNYVLDDGICIECAPGQFYDQIMQSCRPCDPSCRNCNGPDKYSCLSCAQPLKHDHINHRCVWCCDADHIKDCCRCDQLTDTCISVLNTDKRTLNPVKDDGSLIQAQNYFKTFGIAAALTCAIGIIVFLAIFAVLQTRGHNRCSTKGYQRLPMRYEFRKIELSAEDLLENEEFIST